MPAKPQRFILAGVLLLAACAWWLLPDGPASSPPGVQPLPASELHPEKTHSQVSGDGLAPKAPNPWFFVERAYPQGRIPRQEWRKAQHQARALRDAAAVKGGGSWTPLGPTNIGGRVTDVVVDPTDSDILYVGAAEGGVLRSFDAGQTWTPLFDDQASLSVGALALDPSDPHTIYVGTGEVNPGGGSVAYGGAGLFRSTDQGTTWESLGLEETGSIGRILVHPQDPQRLFVAAMGHLWETGPDRGVYRSLDGGASWDLVLAGNDSTGCVDLVMRPDRPDTIYAAMWERIRQPTYYRYGGSGCAVWRTIDGGDSWSLVGGGLPAPTADGGRIGLSLCKAQPDVVHAVYADRIGYFDGLYRSTDGGWAWSQTNDGSLSSVFASYGWWFGNVRTHPVDPDIIFVLGLTFWRSTNGGASYAEVSHIMHVDHHGLDFGSGANPVIYNGNDGGVYRSTNGGSIWTKLPDLPITQIYRVALDAGNPDALYLGAQDNGTCRTLTGAVDDWEMIFGGDGFQSLIHPLDSDQIWVQYQYGNVYYTNDGGWSWFGATGGISGADRFNWNSPLVQDPNDPSRRYFGTNKVYRSTSTTSWAATSGDLTGGPYGGNSGQVNGILTTLNVSPLTGSVIWAGSDDGRVHVSDDRGNNWTDVSAGLPQRWITSVRGDPFDQQTGYVTVSGFRWAEPLPHVFRTTDLGATWVPIAGNLPGAPANDIVIDPDYPTRYFVATDVGVYETLNNGASWNMLGADLPRVVVTSLALEPTNRRLIAGTYGRSFFGYDLEDLTDVADGGHSGTQVGQPGLLGRVQVPFPNPTAGGTRFGWELKRAAPVEVEVVTVAGRRVWSRRLGGYAKGPGWLDWDGRDAQGRRLPAGIYLVRVLAGGELLGSKTVVLQR